MKKVFSIAVAVFFILVGVLGLLSSLTTFSIDWRFLGAAIPLFIGLFFQVQYFTEKKEPGLLVPGGTLTVIGLLVLLDFFFTDSVSEYIWPFYILAPAVGLFQFYWFGKRDRALLIPVTVLSVVCVVFLLVTLYQIPPFSYILPILLLVIGTFMLYTYFRKGRKP